MSVFPLAEKMASKIIHNYFFYLFVFTLFFGVLLYNLIGIKAMDEISGLVLLIFYGIYIFTTNNKKFNAGVLITLSIFIFYFCYSIYVSNNTNQAIILDFLIQIRPYLTFFIVSQIAPSFSDFQKLLLKRLCLIMWIFFIPIGIYGFVNPSFFYTVFEQPSNFIANIGCLSLVYLFCSDFSIRNRFIFTLMLATGLLATHTNFYSIFLLTCGILLYFHHPHIFKFNLRTGIAIAVITLLVIHISRVQISEYVLPSDVVSNEYNQNSRFHLYKTSIDILKDFFPLGSGLASFGTLASGLYYSKIYSRYGLTSIDGLSQQDWFSVSDSYYPSLAQFGIVGIILYLFFWGLILHKALTKFKEKGDMQLFVLVLILVSFVFIENISDSFFTSNKGYYMMMFLGVLFGKKKKLAHTQDDSKNSNAPIKKKRDKKKEKIVKTTTKTKEQIAVSQLSSNSQSSVEEENSIVYQMPPIPIREEDFLEKELRAYTSSQQSDKDELQIQDSKNVMKKETIEESYEDEEYEDEDFYDDEEDEDEDLDQEENDTLETESITDVEKNIKEPTPSGLSSTNIPDNLQEIENANSNEIIKETEVIQTIKAKLPKEEIFEVTDDISSSLDEDELQLNTSLVDDEEELMELLSPTTQHTENKEIHSELQTSGVEKTDLPGILSENNSVSESQTIPNSKTNEASDNPAETPNLQIQENNTDKQNTDKTELIIGNKKDQKLSEDEFIITKSMSEAEAATNISPASEIDSQNNTDTASNLKKEEEVSPDTNEISQKITHVTEITLQEMTEDNITEPKTVISSEIEQEDKTEITSHFEEEILPKSTSNQISEKERSNKMPNIIDIDKLITEQQPANNTDIHSEYTESNVSETNTESDLTENEVESNVNHQIETPSNNEAKDFSVAETLHLTPETEFPAKPDSDLVKKYKDIVNEYSHSKEEASIHKEAEAINEKNIYQTYLEELLTSTKTENKTNPSPPLLNDNDEDLNDQIDYII